ncbi:MAG: WecB/TagA/CpsF family glycosyltransferase [Phycisphaerae bacterium]|nr:WecB/TagA/CpsF family glycosyltransferase [Phycisphaerae bacterium]
MNEQVKALDKKPPAVNILGLNVHAIDMRQLICIADNYIQSRTQLLLGVVNAAKLVNMKKDKTLRQSLEQTDLMLADGMPIVWLSRLLGKPLPGRVAGIEIMYNLMELASKKGYRVFFLGAAENVVQKVAENARENYPGMKIAGYRNGYFSEDDQQDVAEQIKSSRADILFVAITSPRKENFLSKYRLFMDVPIYHGVGGSFDVFAGVTKRAPLWMQRYGLEWFYRFMQEPLRMWKRYLVTNTIFLKLSFQAVLESRYKRVMDK